MDEWTYSPQADSPSKNSTYSELFLLDLVAPTADPTRPSKQNSSQGMHSTTISSHSTRRQLQFDSHVSRPAIGSHSLAQISSQTSSVAPNMAPLDNLALGNDLEGDIDLGSATLDSNFHLDGMDFNVDELAPGSKAFPPLNFPQNTPGLGPMPASFQSPILPGQNERLYNKEHLYHTQRRRDKHLHHTPLQLPAMTPSEQQIAGDRPQFVAPAAFEPLTLPALAAADRRRSLLATFGTDEGTIAKRRTPHLTPILPPKPRRSPSLRKVPQFDQLPDAAANPAEYANTPTAQSLPPAAPGTANVSDAMLPPKRPASQMRSTEDAPTLMGFTMNRLAELQSNSSPSQSPLLAAAKGDPESRRNSSLGEASPMLYAVDGVRREKPTTKKATHKLAEQGRRNRMNQAVHELSKLIPPAYHGLVLIPSKATTVELASSYIRDLLREIDSLNSKLPGA